MSPARDAPVVAVAGQGSIGRRHASNLVELGCRVVTFDPEASNPPPGTEQAESLEAAMDDAGIAVIASPTSEHARQATAAIERGCHVLVEKPLATTVEDAIALVSAAREREVMLAVAMNLRFHPGPAGVKAAVERGDIGRPLLARFTFGSFLPDWRPSIDYRDSYSAHRALGGGVLLDAIHEIDYAIWSLGTVAWVSAWLERISDLEIDTEDAVLLTLGFDSGPVASVELDYLDRSYRRGCRIVGSDGTVVWSWKDQEVVLHRAQGDPQRTRAPADVDPTYRAELERFIAAAAAPRPSLEGTGLASGSEACQALAVVQAARDSAARDGARSKVADAGELGDSSP